MLILGIDLGFIIIIITSLPIESNPIAETQTGPSQLVSPLLTPLLKGKHYSEFYVVLTVVISHNMVVVILDPTRLVSVVISRCT